MLRGVSLSAGQEGREKKTTRARRNLLRIRTLPALFDRRALNRITHCWLRSKSNVGRILCRANRYRDWCDAHGRSAAILSAVSALSKYCTNQGDCYRNSEHPAL